ncbi:MAG: hypothetical protein ACOVQK_08430 [Cyanobium sp.]
MARALPQRDAPPGPALTGALLALLVMGGAHPLAASAQDLSSPNQPQAISAPEALVPSPCKLVVPADQAVLQPMKIRPEQVAFKNRLGCLSPADAVYGPDGCPVRLCGKNEGAFQLPP